MLKIERIETEWTSPEAERYADRLRAEIAKAFQMPEWALHDLTAQQKWRIQIERQTALLQQHLAEVVMQHTRPVATCTEHTDAALSQDQR